VGDSQTQKVVGHSAQVKRVRSVMVLDSPEGNQPWTLQTH
jgi:hypothetical protein